MSAPTEIYVRQLLAGLNDPYAETPLEAAVRAVGVDGARVSVDLSLGYPLAAAAAAELTARVSEQLQAADGIEAAAVSVHIRIYSHKVQAALAPLQGVKNIIVVASGKGGVGKSTVSANLALALQAEGARVGILDADIYGPSQPRMFGLSGKPDSPDGKTIQPLQAHGIQVMSIGFLIEEDTPMIWRGPMVTQAMLQLLNDSRWEQLDYLIMDLPPGTGDIQLTLSQKVPVAGAVVVTTPQDIALLDARKAYKMFEKVGVPVLGVVENMATHICSHCGHEEAIFGHGGGQQMAEDYAIPYLGSLPLDICIRRQADAGTPVVAAFPEGELSGHYRQIARKAAARLALQPRNKALGLGSVVVQSAPAG